MTNLEAKYLIYEPPSRHFILRVKKIICIIGGLVFFSLLIVVSQTDSLLIDNNLYGVSNFFKQNNYESKEEQVEEVEATTHPPFENFQNSSNICVHPEIDIFDPAILKYYMKRAKCNGAPLNITFLVKGILINNNPDTNDCWGRCHRFKGPKENNIGDWHQTTENYTYECDHVEARCAPKGSHIDKAKYFHLHTQLVEIIPSKPKKVALGKQYNVYFITIDSHAYTQQFRNLNSSNKYLLDEMDAILFPYMNRASDGSRENAVAWWFGKLATKIDRTVYGLPSIDPEPFWGTINSCKVGVDNGTFLLKEFEDYGYVTNLAEDWWRAVDYECKGWSGMVTHHHYLPYVVAYEKESKIKSHVLFKECIQRHQPLLDYFSQFIQSYKDKPKIGWSWLCHIGHNNAWESRALDPDLLKFLKDNKDELDNSFLFIGGDHGMRFTAAVKTTVGRLDVNNPLLLMTLPKELRKNKDLMDLVRENSKELQTHFDTRATILDILKYQPAVKFHGRKQLNIPGELGHSFLREQPKPRMCRTLPIHIQSCICVNPLNVNLKNDSAYSTLLGTKIVDSINQKLMKNSYSEMCEKWSFTRVDQLMLVSRSPLHVEGVVLATHPGRTKEDAQFRVYATGNNSTMEIVSLDRLDRYEHSGDCVVKFFQPICSCLKSLSNSTGE